jgi:hypothetical protein
MPKKPGYIKKGKRAIFVRFDPELHKQISEKAEEEGRYLGETVERIVDNYFRAHPVGEMPWRRHPL